MDDKDKAAIETEISTEKGVIKDAQGIIDSDEAKLAVDDAIGDTGPALGPVADVDPIDHPAMDAPLSDPVDVTDFGAKGDGATNDALAINAAVATAGPEPSDDPTPQAPASDLSPGPVTPLPANGLTGPIVADTAEAAAGEIVEPERPQWPHDATPPSMGRIVHYRAANSGESPDGNEFHAALITKVNEDWTISLSVFPEGRNPMFVSFAQFGDGNELPGTWCWPSRV